MTCRDLRTLVALAALMLACAAAWADDEFNPENPPEPQPGYRLTVEATPSSVAAVSGAGRYSKGKIVYVNVSISDSDYRLKHWLLDGEVYGTSGGFYFSMPDRNVTLTAVCELVPFDPANPADPGADYKWRLNLVGVPAEACSFNINSGTKQTQGTQISVRAYANQGFDFDGWYSGGEQVSTANPYTFTMPTAETTLEARYTFNPDSPGEPAFTPIAGDVNYDFLVDISDIQRLLNIMAGNYVPAVGEHSGDVNGDGDTDIADVQRTLNIMAGN